MEAPHPIHLQAADVSTEPGVLGMLARHRDGRVRRLVASNPSTPADRLLWLLGDFPGEVMSNPAMMLGLLANPALIVQAPMKLLFRWASDRTTAIWLFELLARDGEDYTRRTLASNPALPAELLGLLSGDRVAWVREAAAANPSLPRAVLERLATAADPSMRASVARNPSTPPALISALANDADRNVRISTLRHPSLPPEAIDRFASDSMAWVRSQVASRTTSVAVLEQLANDSDPSVRRLVARHPACPPALRQRLADDGG